MRAMKGMVFVELLRMAEDMLGEAAVDAVLDDVDLENGGAYNAVGNYPCRDLMKLVEAFSDRSGAPTNDLQRLFGHWMLDRFASAYPGFFATKSDALQMLEAIEAEVHVEVLKLYPDAELPRFETERLSDGALRLVYRSPRPLVPFCLGLIEACLAHFGQTAETVLVDRSTNNGAEAEFTIRLAA
jgi:hypothetical protein